MIQSADQTDALLKWMGSLADPTRLRLLRILERHEMGVSDLCEVVCMPQSTVSRHLKLLADEAWVVSRREGTTNRYRMVGAELDGAQRDLWSLARDHSRGWATFGQDEIRVKERLRRRGRESGSFFAGAAGDWDRTRIELYGSAFPRDTILGLLPTDWVVADLGCGTGTIAADLARSACRVIGVDNSEAMLAAARKRTEHMGNVELRLGELATIPIDDASCDAAVLVLVLTYLPEPSIVLDQMWRILKAGGRAVVVDLLRHDRDDFRRQMGQHTLGYEADQLSAMLQDAGFDRVSCASLPPEAEATGPALLMATADAADDR